MAACCSGVTHHGSPCPCPWPPALPNHADPCLPSPSPCWPSPGQCHQLTCIVLHRQRLPPHKRVVVLLDLIVPWPGCGRAGGWVVGWVCAGHAHTGGWMQGMHRPGAVVRCSSRTLRVTGQSMHVVEASTLLLPSILCRRCCGSYTLLHLWPAPAPWALFSCPALPPGHPRTPSPLPLHSPAISPANTAHTWPRLTAWQ